MLKNYFFLSFFCPSVRPGWSGRLGSVRPSRVVRTGSVRPSRADKQRPARKTCKQDAKTKKRNVTIRSAPKKALYKFP